MESKGELRRIIEKEGTIMAAFEAACRKYPDKTALVFLGTRFTYSQLRDLVSRFASACHALGVGDNDRVLIYLPSCPQWVVTYLGLQEIGAVPVPVSSRYTPYELIFLLSHSGSETIVCADTNFGYVKEVLPKTPVQRIIATSITDLLPLWKRAFGKLFDKLIEGSVSGDENVYLFKNLLRGNPHKPPEIEIDPETHLAHMLYTGGTTGFPKGITHSHLELLSGVVGIREVYREFIQEGKNTLIMPLHLFHMFSQDMIFALGLHLGNTIVILPKSNTDAVLASIQEHKGTLLAGVPTLFRQILENDRLELYDLSSLKYCWSAGDTLPVEVSLRWKKKFGIPIHQVYGSTETVCVSVSPLGEEPAPQSVGRLLPTRLAKVVDPDSMAPVSFGVAGELLISSDYSSGEEADRDNPRQLKETLVRLDDRNWRRTGDYVTLSADGEIEFIDRSADLIKHKGYRVSAARVESVLQDHPTVVAACVVGTPDAMAGENVKAFVILKEDARGVTSYDLMKHCRDRLLPYEVPSYIEFRDMLPKSKVGKLLRREIKKEELRKVERLHFPYISD